MYPSFEDMNAYLDNEPDKPFILIEYCHAMGNGPGDLEEYFQFFHENELMHGSYNWTPTADYNEETLATALDKEFVKKFADEFMRMWISLKYDVR